MSHQDEAIQDQGPFSFPLSEVRELLEHARSCKEHAPTFGQLMDPALRFDGKAPESLQDLRSGDVDHSLVPYGLHLVGDHGVYLMSNGTPHLPGTKTRNRVVYAHGINPEVDEDFYDAKHDLFGGDDGVIDIDGKAVDMLLQRATSRDAYITFFFSGDKMIQVLSSRPDEGADLAERRATAGRSPGVG